jgi:hypothetical protein
MQTFSFCHQEGNNLWQRRRPVGPVARHIPEHQLPYLPHFMPGLLIATKILEMEMPSG